MVKENSITLYAIRDRSTGKFATNLTNPSHKFWEKRGSCESALAAYKRRYYNKAARTYKHKPEDLEVVELLFVESKNIQMTIHEGLMPSKPIVTRPYSNSDSVEDYKCPACGDRLISRVQGQWTAGRFVKHCPECGQAIDWEDKPNG